MLNQAMKRKLDAKEAIDVSKCERDGTFYIVTDSVATEEAIRDDGLDFCDKAEERWIWSIGKRHTDGKILASLSAEFYQNPDYECIWLR